MKERKKAHQYYAYIYYTVSIDATTNTTVGVVFEIVCGGVVSGTNNRVESIV
jgi:hypothetical protein